MAPSKKSKSVNRRFVAVNDIPPLNDLGTTDKSKQKKRKLADMLGPQWSKQELGRFYEAYRKYGQDWKKVANYLQTRSEEMVEALYCMNRAYLSLPEGVASVAGLVAMMTDHYNVLDISGNGRDCDDPSSLPQKSQKYSKGKSRVGMHKEEQSQTVPPSDGCLSLLKWSCQGIHPRFPVKKRTPRVAVSSPEKKDYVMNYLSPNKKARNSAQTANDVEDSCQVSPTPYGKTQYVNLSFISTAEKRTPQAKHIHVAMNEEFTEDSVESSIPRNGDFLKKAKSGTLEDKKANKVESKNSEAQGGDSIVGSYNGAVGLEANLARKPKIDRSPSQGQRKTNKKLSFPDNNADFNALETLAELSLLMPSLAEEHVDAARESVTGKDANAAKSVKIKNSNRQNKKRRKSEALKIPKAEVQSDSSPAKLLEDVASADEEFKSTDGSRQMCALPTLCRSSVKSPDVSSSNDPRLMEPDVSVCSAPVPSSTDGVPTAKAKSRRKRDSASIHRDKTYAQNSSRAWPDKCSSRLSDRALCLKEKLSHSLSCYDVRKWCVYEWFYSALDYPWFAKQEFVEYLNHVGLGHVPRLTRVEWGVIRSSLGKPRRFSERFLEEEREKLEKYRESVRKHYAELRSGLREGLHTDLARPLSVGQHVIAIHPKTRECDDGSILTVDHDRCLVQFDSPELGVESIMDIDCMPSNPLENMPETLRRQKTPFEFRNVKEPIVNGTLMLAPNRHLETADVHPWIPPLSQYNQAKVNASSMVSHAETANGIFRTPSAMPIQSHGMVQMQQRKDDVKRTPELTCTLDRKVNSSLLGLEQLGAHPANSYFWPPHIPNLANANGHVRFLSISGSSKEKGSNVAQIVEGSREQAHKMVDTAIQALSLTKGGEDAYERIREALDAPSKSQSTINSGSSVTTSTSSAHTGLAHRNQTNGNIPKCSLADDYSGAKLSGTSSENDLQVPSELITSCVATLLMIQTCTERQYPPGEVAQIIDAAMTGLHPSCPQNLSLYRDLQLCMGRIKSQILALVPT